MLLNASRSLRSIVREFHYPHSISCRSASKISKPVNLPAWIESIKDELKPPVANRLLYGDNQLLVQVVGGPNERLDFHINQGEEFFYQIKGDMQLNVVEKGMFKEIPIREGEIFLLPSSIPHSPQRYSNTIGLVIERKRMPKELDGMRWYIPNTTDILYEDWFHCTDLGKQLVPIIEKYKKSKEFQTQKAQKSYNSPISIPKTVDTVKPIKLSTLVQDTAIQNPFGKHIKEFDIRILSGKRKNEVISSIHEMFYFQINGASTIHIVYPISEKIQLISGNTILIPPNYKYNLSQHEDSTLLSVVNFVSKS